MNNNIIDLSQATSVQKDGSYVTNTSAGGFDGRVSSQWFTRPDDQKFLDLNSLYDFTKKSADNSFDFIVNPKDIEVRATSDDPDELSLVVPYSKNGQNSEIITHANHYSFGQLSSLVQAPASYLRKLPAQLAGINLQYGLSGYRKGDVKPYITTNGHAELRAATGPDYGRIFDYEVVAAVQKLAGNGNGDTNWKVPGVLDWRAGTYNPDAPITRESTTLFASDRDIFLFLVDDKHPIKIGTFKNPKTGEVEDDLLFRGFYVWNSEVGNRSLGIACFYLRGVCQNRCLWGVEGYQEIRLAHSKNAPQRFIDEAKPALESFTQNNTSALLAGVQAAREAVVARDDDDRREFLTKQGFNKNTVNDIIQTVVDEEGVEPKSVWDFVQGITAVARKEGRQDTRLDLEKKAGRLLNKVA